MIGNNWLHRRDPSNAEGWAEGEAAALKKELGPDPTPTEVRGNGSARPHISGRVQAWLRPDRASAISSQIEQHHMKKYEGIFTSALV